MQLQRHFQADTLPWIQRMQQKEQILQRRLLRVCATILYLRMKLNDSFFKKNVHNDLHLRKQVAD